MVPMSSCSARSADRHAPPPHDLGRVFIHKTREFGEKDDCNRESVFASGPFRINDAFIHWSGNNVLKMTFRKDKFFKVYPKSLAEIALASRLNNRFNDPAISGCISARLMPEMSLKLLAQG